MHHAPHLLRLRESGAIPSNTKFRTVLNVRSVAIQREIKDRDKVYDESKKSRLEADELLDELEEAYCFGHTIEAVRRLKDAYKKAEDRVDAAQKRRNARVEWLHTSLALIKAAMRSSKQARVHLELHAFRMSRDKWLQL